MAPATWMVPVWSPNGKLFKRRLQVVIALNIYSTEKKQPYSPRLQLDLRIQHHSTRLILDPRSLHGKGIG